MRAGDLIYVKEGPSIVGRGIVIGPYRFEAENPIVVPGGQCAFHHQRRVHWCPEFQEVQTTLGQPAITTLLRLTHDDVEQIEVRFEGGAAMPPIEDTETNPPTHFEVGREYSREEISAALGGSRQLYLPTNDGRVVCGCFKTTPRYNPGAPTVVTFGPGRIVKQNAEVVSQQAEPIPVFLFQGGSAWRYVGRYRCSRLSKDAAVLRHEMEANPARGPISGVLYFERVGD